MNKQAYTIPSWNLGKVEETITKLNRRAAKNGLPTLKLVKIAERQIDDPTINPDRKRELNSWGLPIPKITVIDFELTGDPIKLEGWTFIGTLDHHSIPNAVVVKTVPGQTIPEKYFTAHPICNHCNKIRIRTETFVCRHENGEEKQVGRQCVKDFFGTDPHQLMSYLTSIFKMMKSFGEDEENFRDYGARREYSFDIESVLSLTSCVIKKDGWVSRKMAEDRGCQSTSHMVSYLLSPPWSGEAREQWERIKREYVISDEDKAVVPKVREWVRGQNASNEYMHNIKAIEASNEVNVTLVGMAASMVSSYLRAMETLRLKAFDKKLNEWIGAVGQKLEVEIVVTGISYVESEWGRTAIHRMRDNDGRTLVWFASGEKTLTEGKKYLIRGTVKKLDEYKDWKQTVLTRVKSLKELEVQNA